jgi:hypothetical protein
MAEYYMWHQGMQLLGYLDACYGHSLGVKMVLKVRPINMSTLLYLMQFCVGRSPVGQVAWHSETVVRAVRQLALVEPWWSTIQL